MSLYAGIHSTPVRVCGTLLEIASSRLPSQKMGTTSVTVVQVVCRSHMPSAPYGSRNGMRRALGCTQGRALRGEIRLRAGHGFPAVRFIDNVIADKHRIGVVLENNNEHLKQLSAEGLLLFHALLSPRQEVVFGSCLWVGPGEPGSAAVQFVHPFAW
jgi:hypothetical protein